MDRISKKIQEVKKNSNNSEEMMALVHRALLHYKNKTTDQAKSIMTMPIEAYINEERYLKEKDRIYKKLPLALCLSKEVPENQTYRAMNVIDTPVLITRGQDSKVRAFLNVCRHRGSKICEEGSGKIDREKFGLIELECEENAGFIWVILTPGKELNITSWLGDFGPELESLNLKDWYIFDQRELQGPGWKVALDGYLEAYHHNQLHGKTVGKHTVGNLLVLDTYGPHQRLTFGRKSLGSLEETPESEWQPLENIRLIHSGFPNLSVSGVLGDHCLVSQIFPGNTPYTTTTRQTILSAKKPKTKEEIAYSKNFSDMVLQAVKDEDYKIGMEIQSNIKKLGDNNFVYGKNEPAVQNYHNWIKRFMKSQGTAW